VRDFHLDSVSAGQEAQGRVKIVAVAPEGTFAGVGTSTDIVEASALAYMDVVNKIHRMRKFAPRSAQPFVRAHGFAVVRARASFFHHREHGEPRGRKMKGF
jgi:hypothetical protein